eukprot:7368728-Prymnesium_polylepis.1
MMCRILANLDDALAFRTNWDITELAPAAQARYAKITNYTSLTNTFGTVTLKLWPDPLQKYIVDGLDDRDQADVELLLDSAARQATSLIAEAAAASVPIRKVLHHRSMPFGFRGTPYFEDLPRLASRLPAAWGSDSRAVLSLRQAPEMWASHVTSSKATFEPYFHAIEHMLSTCCATEDAPCSRAPGCPVFVRYERVLANATKEEVSRLCPPATRRNHAQLARRCAGGSTTFPFGCVPCDGRSAKTDAERGTAH